MGYDHFYLDDNQNRREMQRAVVSNYTPAIKLIERLVETRGSKFAISISISGAALEQLREYSPLMIDQLCHLAQFRQIEWIAETHHHTLSSLFDYKEFQTQVDNYRQLLDEILSVKATTFRNTDLIYTPTIGRWVSQMGFTAMLVGGVQSDTLHFNSKHPKTKLLSYSTWQNFDSLNRWINRSQGDLFCTTIFGEDINNSNVAEFEDAINRLMNNEEVALSVPREIVGRLKAEHILKIASEGGLSDWAQNELQREAINQIYNLRDRVKSLNNVNLTNAWRLLQSVDNFRPMSLDLTDSNPYGTPYEAFINYMNVLGDFNQVLNSKSTVLSLSEKK
jgi:alpha-amylase